MRTPMKITGISGEMRLLVVELFRCAADLLENGCRGRPSVVPLDDAAREMFGEEHSLARTHPAYDIACAAIEDLDLGECSTEQLLEAALLVDGKEWP